jgi:hypothetical protein
MSHSATKSLQFIASLRSKEQRNVNRKKDAERDKYTNWEERKLEEGRE